MQRKQQIAMAWAQRLAMTLALLIAISGAALWHLVLIERQLHDLAVRDTRIRTLLDDLHQETHPKPASHKVYSRNRRHALLNELEDACKKTVLAPLALALTQAGQTLPDTMDGPSARPAWDAWRHALDNMSHARHTAIETAAVASDRSRAFAHAALLLTLAAEFALVGWVLWCNARETSTLQTSRR